MQAMQLVTFNLLVVHLVLDLPVGLLVHQLLQRQVLPQLVVREDQVVLVVLHMLEV